MFFGAPIFTPKLRIYVNDGDSISAGLTTYPTLFLQSSGPRAVLVNMAVVASTLADVIARQGTADAVVPCNNDAPSFVFSAMIGGNGFGSAGSQLLLDQIESLRTYYLARRTAGFKVVGITWLPRTTPLFNAARAQVNTAIRTWVGTNIDALADFAADPTMGPNTVCPDSGTFNPTWYSDGIHPTAAGQAILETIIRPVINGL